ncbi:MAG: hypothetical protein V3W34_07765, partial [Phycisphaerae bacterium]
MIRRKQLIVLLIGVCLLGVLAGLNGAGGADQPKTAAVSGAIATVKPVSPKQVAFDTDALRAKFGEYVQPLGRKGAKQVSSTESPVIDKATVFHKFCAEDLTSPREGKRSAKYEHWAVLASPARTGDRRKVHVRQSRPTLVPAEEVEIDTPALHAKFSEEVSQLGLGAIGDVVISPVNETLVRASLLAVGLVSDLSGALVRRQDVFYIGEEVLGTAPIVTMDFLLERDGNQLKLETVLHFHDAIDRMARAPTGIAGTVIEYSAVASFGDFDALLKDLAARRDSGNGADLDVSEWQARWVTDFVARVKVTNGQGRSMTYAAAEMTLGEAMSQLGGGCPSCYSDCFAQFECGVGIAQIPCLLIALLPCTIPCALGPNPACLTCVGLALLACGIPCTVQDLAVCLVSCLLSGDPGEVPDCCGNCAPARWVGDNSCDDGSFTHNGVPIYLNCGAFDCDAGDCPSSNCGGCPPSEVCCCPDLTCFEGVSAGECSAAQCVPRGEGTCASVGCPCDGQAGCVWCWKGTEFENNCPDGWCGDGECDCGCQFCDSDCPGCPPSCGDGDACCGPHVPSAECLDLPREQCLTAGGAPAAGPCPDDCPLCDAPCVWCWVRTAAENNCPEEWCGDGECDCGCQFSDTDCPGGTCNGDACCGPHVASAECLALPPDQCLAAGGAPTAGPCPDDCPLCDAPCVWCWTGTTAENNCPEEWCGDGECDCGCQFSDIDCLGAGSCREVCCGP